MPTEEGKERKDKEIKENNKKCHEIDAISLELSTLKRTMSDDESSKKISSEISTLKNATSEMINSFNKNSDYISDYANNFHAGMNRKCK